MVKSSLVFFMVLAITCALLCRADEDPLRPMSIITKSLTRLVDGSLLSQATDQLLSLPKGKNEKESSPSNENSPSATE
ncbi:hypothetical protein MRX96_043171 [Rhipicephalus microplus]